MKWAGFARPFESNPGSPQKREAFVRGVPHPGATYFCFQTKVGKSWLRGSAPKDPMALGEGHRKGDWLPSGRQSRWSTGLTAVLYPPFPLR